MGRPVVEPRRAWFEFRSAVKEFVWLCGARDRDSALRQVEVIRESWRQLDHHGLEVVGALLNEVLVRFGEETIHDVFLEAEKGNFARRYQQFDVSKHPWDECLGPLLYITFEGGRMHLAGPSRLGGMEFWEEDTRWGWRWDPCGSCGTIIRGDETEGVPPRSDPPYRWSVLGRQFGWAWGKAGMTPYAVHSFVKLAEISIGELGYPLREVDCPTEPGGRSRPCERYVYKSLDLVPDRIYDLAGTSRPEAYGSRRDVLRQSAGEQAAK